MKIIPISHSRTKTITLCTCCINYYFAPPLKVVLMGLKWAIVIDEIKLYFTVWKTLFHTLLHLHLPRFCLIASEIRNTENIT
jgi:hypothetical protein